MRKALQINGTRERLSKLPSILHFDSTCTGSGCFELVSNAICTAIESELSNTGSLTVAKLNRGGVNDKSTLNSAMLCVCLL